MAEPASQAGSIVQATDDDIEQAVEDSISYYLKSWLSRAQGMTGAQALSRMYQTVHSPYEPVTAPSNPEKGVVLTDSLGEYVFVPYYEGPEEDPELQRELQQLNVSLGAIVGDPAGDKAINLKIDSELRKVDRQGFLCLDLQTNTSFNDKIMALAKYRVMNMAGEKLIPPKEKEVSSYLHKLCPGGTFDVIALNLPTHLVKKELFVKRLDRAANIDHHIDMAIFRDLQWRLLYIESNWERLSTLLIRDAKKLRLSVESAFRTHGKKKRLWAYSESKFTSEDDLSSHDWIELRNEQVYNIMMRSTKSSTAELTFASSCDLDFSRNYAALRDLESQRDQALKDGGVDLKKHKDMYHMFFTRCFHPLFKEASKQEFWQDFLDGMGPRAGNDPLSDVPWRHMPPQSAAPLSSWDEKNMVFKIPKARSGI